MKICGHNPEFPFRNFWRNAESLT